MREPNPIQKPPSARVLANRSKIFAVAIELIKRRGFDSVTMSDIARQAGVARASVFNHFPAKLAFLAEWYQSFTREVLREAREIKEGGVWDRLEFLFREFGKGAQEHKEIVVHVAALAMGHGPLAAVESELDNELEDYFLELIVLGQADGHLKKDLDPQILVSLFVGLLTVTAHDWVNSGQTSDLAEDLILRFRILFSGIER